MIQIITAITMMSAIMPTAAPALNMPAIAEQLLKKIAIRMMATGILNFFIQYCL